MKEFMFIFRREAISPDNQPSPEQFQAILKQWQDWIGQLSANNQLLARGSRLSFDGRVITPNKTVTNGPFVEIKEILNGYLFVCAPSIEEAVELGKGCPILSNGGTVEVRPVISEDGSH